VDRSAHRPRAQHLTLGDGIVDGGLGLPWQPHPERPFAATQILSLHGSQPGHDIDRLASVIAAQQQVRHAVPHDVGAGKGGHAAIVAR